ncbi:MAG: hypothetical protein ACRDBP_19055 [Luteolibacter sp.]
MFTTGYTATGLHALSVSDWSIPAGYSSSNSLSSNSWTVGDYYQFHSSSVGYTGITIAFGQTSSNTGPAEFRVDYSSDGSTFSISANYLVLANAGTNGWSNSVTISNTAYSFDLGTVTSLDNQANIFFRLDISGLADAIPAGDFAVEGISRIDNFIISDTPEPDAAALIDTFSLLTLLRRRR